MMGTIRQHRASLLPVYPDSLMVILSHCSEKKMLLVAWNDLTLMFLVKKK